MLIENFQIEDKASRPKFFQQTFLMTNIKFEIILRIFFLKISNIDMLFGERTLM